MTTTQTFDSFGLSPEAMLALKQARYQTPTPIQAAAIPRVLAGEDVIGCAPTGTGKTAAFVLPMLERMSGGAETTALILVPTRELAIQIARQVQAFGGSRGVRTATLIGGVAIEEQLNALDRGAHVVVATPGRMVDHLTQQSIRLDHIEILVLDEADRMLDMGFKPQLTQILEKVPRDRQTLLFSATIEGEVAKFAAANLRAPVKVEVAPSGTPAEGAEQLLYEVGQTEKMPLLFVLLKEYPQSTLIFTRTKRRADKITTALERAKLRVETLHADRSQGQRRHALEGFRQGKYRVLVATDIAARGLDVADIGHVINYDLPHVAEDYVHRIGRTARASKSGRATSFAAPEDADLLRAIERVTCAPVPRAEVPRSHPVFKATVRELDERQRDPGPPQAGHGVPTREADKPLGRHARSHKKRS